MATERNKQSVIATLMGLHEVPLKKQPVHRSKRILSENYLQKSASLGSRERRASIFRQKNQEISKKSDSTSNDSSKERSQSSDSHTTFGWEFKKQLLERSKRAKVCREIWSGIRVCNLVEVTSMAGLESKHRLELGTRVPIRSNEGWKDNPVTKLPIPKHTPLHILQDSPCEDGFTSLNCIDIDDELRMNTTEAHQPSPNSVLEPDNASIFEYGDNVSTDLHGLWMKLQILKSESEENQSKPKIVASSDADADGDRDATGICFGPKESQEFSYLVSVLDEIGSFERWHFVEHIMGPLSFERLEKKYAKQESWNKADRRLLFDRIELRLSEILRPYVNFTDCSKLLRRKMSTVLRRDVIEEELWNILVSERNEVNVDLSEKAVGKEPWLKELGEEVDSIVGEIEAFLFNELALELVDF